LSFHTKHWYPQSPFAQKIVAILNYKKLDYKLVQISMMEPRPLRRPLDANYPKTPILQIGNQVFCDTKAIIAELESRYPEPSLYPPLKHSGQSSKTLAFGMTNLLDTSIFAAVPTQFNLDVIPLALLEDRAKMKGNGKFDVAKTKALQPYLKLELQAQLDRLTAGLVRGQWILDTETPSDSDFSLFMITFFLNMVINDAWTKEHYPLLVEHFERMVVLTLPDRADTMPQISAEDALQIAKVQQAPHSVSTSLSPSAQGIARIGQKVSVTPLDMGKTPAVGELAALTSDRVVLRINDDRTGDVYVHFPLTAYVVVPITSHL
jgi:glutathione S-transferase